MKRRAFTLVELLVVISIIALLLALLMPALGKAKKQAQAVVCRTNLKQWGLGWTMYAQENNGCFFHGLEGLPPPDDDKWTDYWYIKLWRYVKAEQIRFCPTAIKPLPSQTSASNATGGPFAPWGPYGFIDDTTGSVGRSAYLSYGANAFVAKPRVGVNQLIYGNDRNNFWGRNDVKGASTVPLMLDAAWTGAYPNNGQNPISQNPIDRDVININNRDTINAFCMDRHSGTVNCVFLDGSCRKVGLKELWKLKWHRNYDTSSGPKKWPVWMAKFN